MDPDPDSDPAIIVSDLQDAKKNLIKKVTFTSFFKDKSKKKSQNSKNQGFFLTIFA
jgi:hypothetical protein